MTDKAEKARRKALSRWEGEGGATKDGPQQVESKKRRPRDANLLAKSIVDVATGETEDREPTPEEQGKDPAAVSLGRRGGLKGGRARAKKLSAAQRKAIAKHAAQARWKTP